MRTRMTQHSSSNLVLLVSPLSMLLISVVLLFITITPSYATVNPESISNEPYQYFHSDGVGGSNAVCWLSRVPMPIIQGVQCRFADTISQIKGRQIWQCEGDQIKFCDACHDLEKQLTDPKDLVRWKVQGC
ncbi:uncharacterized protein MEPE_04286 [Melanopsichium pennsylvanicum]|uniref:Uncharacterized protein n=1 Tax=Melanopsichium pennsylvanicum TaxID=63383 RepID=A0AAJ5C688_9BASI|nr:uncharacterized protein MEPE_04286 [Melanopsichium pennsylvanicum]